MRRQALATLTVKGDPSCGAAVTERKVRAPFVVAVGERREGFGDRRLASSVLAERPPPSKRTPSVEPTIPFDVQAEIAYTACSMQYTIRNVPAHLDQALRQRAQKQSRSLNEVAVEALLSALGLVGQPVRQRDLGDIAGSWIEDGEIDDALEDQRRVDPELWR